MIPLDIYTKLPSGMVEYLDAYGFHFSKKACQFAIYGMETTDGDKHMKMTPKEEIERILESYSCMPENNYGYDAVYLYHMAISDYPITLPDEARRASYVKETLDDKDASAESVFRCWLAKMTGNGIPIIWNDLM